MCFSVYSADDILSCKIFTIIYMYVGIHLITPTRCWGKSHINAFTDDCFGTTILWYYAGFLPGDGSEGITSVYDAGPTSTQHWFNVSCLLVQLIIIVLYDPIAIEPRDQLISLFVLIWVMKAVWKGTKEFRNIVQYGSLIIYQAPNALFEYLIWNNNRMTLSYSTVNRGYFTTPGAILPSPLIIDKILWFSINTLSGQYHNIKYHKWYLLKTRGFFQLSKGVAK